MFTRAERGMSHFVIEHRMHTRRTREPNLVGHFLAAIATFKEVEIVAE